MFHIYVSCNNVYYAFSTDNIEDAQKYFYGYNSLEGAVVDVEREEDDD